MKCVQKLNIIVKIVILVQFCYTEIGQRIVKCGGMRHTSLIPDEELNSLMYKTFFCVYVNTYGNYKLYKTVRAYVIFDYIFPLIT